MPGTSPVIYVGIKTSRKVKLKLTNMRRASRINA